SSLFGKGIGSILLANDGSIFGGFVVPHNEYIRFYYETGYVGSILLLGTFIFTFWLIYRELDKKIRLYYISFVIGTLIYSFSDNTFS
ncbi:O-antigen ligase family protein, partial [Bacillus cereus group sp. BC309]